MHCCRRLSVDMMLRLILCTMHNHMWIKSLSIEKKGWSLEKVLYRPDWTIDNASSLWGGWVGATNNLKEPDKGWRECSRLLIAHLDDLCIDHWSSMLIIQCQYHINRETGTTSMYYSNYQGSRTAQIFCPGQRVGWGQVAQSRKTTTKLLQFQINYNKFH